MFVRRTITRVAVAGVSTALAAGGIVAATTTGADAAAAQGTYACKALGSPLGNFPLSLSVPLLPKSSTAGQPVPADLLSYTSKITVPKDPAQFLTSNGVDGGTVADFAIRIGSTVIHAPGTYTAGAVAGNGSIPMDGSGSNKAFTLPRANTYNVLLPAAFTFTPTVGGVPLAIGGAPVTVSCTTSAPATLARVVLVKQSVKVTAKSITVRKGQVAKLPVIVTNQFGTPTGTVVAKERTKTLGSAKLSKGRAAISLGRKLTVGKHTVVVSYGGDGFTKAGKSAPVTVTVKR